VVFAFTLLISVQFLITLLHDLVEVPGWTHTSQVQAVLGKGKLWAATLINSIFPGVAMAFALYFWHRPRPAYVSQYWLIYCAVSVLSAIGMWYWPYFLGASEKTKDEYRQFYAGTYQVLPSRGDNPRPNVLHLLIHVVYAATLLLAIFIYMRRA
jgi:hypothetical protein